MAWFHLWSKSGLLGVDSPTFSNTHLDVELQVNFSSPHIFIGEDLFSDGKDSVFLEQTPVPTGDIPTTEAYVQQSVEFLPEFRQFADIQKPTLRWKVAMKKRRSLQSIFIPPFLHSSSLTEIVESSPVSEVIPESSLLSIHRDLPPDFLLDDDPFANLSAPSIPSHSPPSAPTPTHTASLDSRSPLTPGASVIKPGFLSSPPRPLLQSKMSRTLSGRVLPASQKPAFPPRPSLPSLGALAQMQLNDVLPKKIRKGRVGAGLPFEPWDNLDDGTSSSSVSQLSMTTSPSFISSMGAPAPPDTHSFVADLDLDLDLDFMEFLSNKGHVSGSSSHSASPVNHPLSLSSTFSRDLPNNTDSEAFLSTRLEASLSIDPKLSLDVASEISLNANTGSGIPLDEQSAPSLSPKAPSELSTLTRSTSTSSTSSSESSSGYQWSSGRNTSISSAEDSDFLGALDECFTFPTLSNSFNAITDAPWSPINPCKAYDLNILNEHEAIYRPRTIAESIQPLISEISFPSVTSPTQMDDEAFDGGERHQDYGSVPRDRGWNQEYDRSRGRAGGVSGRGGNPSGIGGNGLGGGGDDGDDEKRFNRSTFSSPSDSEASTDAEDDSTDECGEPAEDASASDDDVPLAQRIPTALKVQKTIRRQVREEREQRKKTRTLRAMESASPPGLQPTFRPRISEGLFHPGTPSSQDATLHASRSVGRPRTRTLPTTMQPVFPQEITKKLQVVAVNDVSLPHSFSRTTPKMDMPRRSKSTGRGLREPGTPLQHVSSRPRSPPAPENSRSFRRIPSSHRTENRKPDDRRAAPVPSDAEPKVSRNPRTRDENSSPRAISARNNQEDSSLRLPPRKSVEEFRKVMKAGPDPRSAGSPGELDKLPRPSLQRPPVPPLPVGDALATPPHVVNRAPVTQQRVFIGDMQRYSMVEITSLTNAADVIQMIEAQGSLKEWVGSGGWMVWEIAQDFGMERPIRSFELLTDVQASWNKEKMMNTFLLKLTPLAAALSRSAMPSASPTYARYVEWESKRGKWSKRWLQLREHGLYISKRDNGKDGALLCSLSNFDAYFITRPYKAPRPFSFAVKSTDNLSLFENTADYLHIFSCPEAEGPIWMEKILLARSYVLHQEKHVLFNPKATGGNNIGGASSLSRSVTRKPSVSHRPLVSVVPSYATVQNPNDVFEPGSLLSKHL